MIQSHIGHIQFNIDMQNAGFYKDLLAFMGWSVWYDDPNLLGLGDSQNASLWFSSVTKPCANDYDGPGANHLGLAVAAQADVDAVVDFLKERGIPTMFDTPRHRPEFSAPGQTYYQVMFESPDHILFEVVYTGLAA
jgi:hypothetical protein